MILTNTEKDRLLNSKLTRKNIKKLKENKMDYILDQVVAHMPEFCPAYTPLVCDWELDSKIGEGAYGDVYKACCEDSCKYVLKWQKFVGGEISPNTVKKEIENQELFAKLGFAVPVTESHICEEGAFIIMPSLKKTLAESVKKDSVKTIISNVYQVLDMLEAIHDEGYYHGDPHLENIMYSISEDRFYFIDLESVGKISDSYPESEDFSRFLSSFEYEIESLPESEKREELFDFYESLQNNFEDRFYSVN
jgi:tRNA A-37 threonylcarbamoyl transferase component Bud32